MVQNKIDKRAAVVFADIDIDKFCKINNDSIQYEEPSKFPSIEIDLSFISSKFEPIKKAIQNAQSPLIKSFEVIDIYEGEDENFKSIAVRLTFSDSSRTLTKDEVTKVSDKIVEDLKQNGILLKS